MNYAIYQISSGKFVEWVTKTGRVRLAKSPFNSNYFIGYEYALAWQIEKGLNTSDYEIKQFEKVMEKTESILKNGSSVWLFDGDDYRQEKIVRLDPTIGMYELTDGNFWSIEDLFKTKKLCMGNH